MNLVVLLQKVKDKDDYLIKLLSQFPEIEFNILSKRQDITIPSELILSKNKKKIGIGVFCRLIKWQKFQAIY